MYSLRHRQVMLLFPCEISLLIWQGNNNSAMSPSCLQKNSDRASEPMLGNYNTSVSLCLVVWVISFYDTKITKTSNQLSWHKGAKKIPVWTRPSPTKIRVARSKDWHYVSPINGKSCKVRVILPENAGVDTSPLIRSALTWSGKSLVLSCVIDKTLFGKSGFRLEDK